MTAELRDGERDLLVRCIGRNPSDDERIRELCTARLDWNALLLASLWHKVAFLVYARLRATGAVDLALTEGNLPLLLLNHWKQLAKVNEIRSNLYSSAARDISAAAERCGADLAVAKGGVALFGVVYTPAERKTYDVDFLGRRDQLEAIEEALALCGFGYGEYSHASETIQPPRHDDRRKHLLQGRGLPNFVRKPESQVVDYMVAQVRFRIGSGSADGRWIPAEPLLERAETRDGIRVVSWPDLALQLALHLHREAHESEYRQWNLDANLVKICDFERVVNAPEAGVTPAELAERAAELGFREEVAFAARVTAAIFPCVALDELADRCGAGTAAEGEILDAIWTVGHTLEGQSGAWQQIAGAKTT